MRMVSPKYGSDHIAEIGYDEESGTLFVRFHRGGIYSYGGVNAGTYNRLLTAASPGGFFRSEIKGRYRHRRLSG